MDETGRGDTPTPGEGPHNTGDADGHHRHSEQPHRAASAPEHAPGPGNPRGRSGAWIDPETGTLHLDGHRFDAWAPPELKNGSPADPAEVPQPSSALDAGPAVAEQQATAWAIRPRRPDDPFAYALHLCDESGAEIWVSLDPATMKSMREAFDTVHQAQHFFLTGTYPSAETQAGLSGQVRSARAHVPAVDIAVEDDVYDGDDWVNSADGSDDPRAGLIGWVLRHKILGFLLAVIMTCVLISALGGAVKI